MIVVNPHGMDVVFWLDYTGGNLAQKISVLKVDDESEWRRWGAHALHLLRTKGIVAPDPYQFPDFVSWATRFNQVIQEI